MAEAEQAAKSSTGWREQSARVDEHAAERARQHPLGAAAARCARAQGESNADADRGWPRAAELDVRWMWPRADLGHVFQ